MMKINFYTLQSVSHNIKKGKHSKEGPDFASVLQKACKEVNLEASSFSSEAPLTDKAIKLAEEIIGTLEKISEFGMFPSQKLAQEIEHRVQALREEAKLVSGSSKKFLEEVMLLGVVEAQKLRQGFYS